jgi:transcriptional regulator with XRE-family HTH domain
MGIKLGDNMEHYILKWLKTTDIPLSVISRQTGISRKSLYNWRKGGNPSVSSIAKLEAFYSNSPSVTEEIKKNGIVKEQAVTKEQIIALQNNYIETLENEKVRNDLWEILDYDVYQTIQLRREGLFPMKLYRTMIDLGDKKIWSEHLGYTISEIDKFFDIGVEYPIFEHPIHSIITNDANNYLEKVARHFMSLFAMMKNVVGTYYIPFHLAYKKKDGSTLPSTAYCVIDWKNLLVNAKVKFHSV